MTEQKVLPKPDQPTSEVLHKELTPRIEPISQSQPSLPPIPPPVTPTRKSRFGLWLIVGIVVLAGGIGGVFWWLKAPKEHAKPVPSEISGQPKDILIPDESQLRQIAVEPVGQVTIAVDRDTTGKVSFNEDRMTPVFAPYAGRVVEILANKGDTVKTGQPLLVVVSPDVVAAGNDLSAARSDVSKARISLDAARIGAERARRLHEREALSTKDLQQAEADLARSEDDYKRALAAKEAAENKLTLYGKGQDELSQPGKSVDSRVVIRAPIGGTIVDRKVGTGQFIKSDLPDPLFLISDLSKLWILADVYESDLASIKLNAPVTITVAAFPNHTFPARISFISPTVDSATRTVRVRCLVENTAGLLKPDMFATIKITGVNQESVPVVSSSAVITEGNDTMVFVEESPGRFRRRHIKVGSETGGSLIVKDGLQPGERVATRGGLLLNEQMKNEE